MYCSACGNANAPDASYCSGCGVAIAPAVAADSPLAQSTLSARAATSTVPMPRSETCGEAVTSMVLGIAGLALCPVVAPFAITSSNSARRKIRESRGRLTGDGMAVAGVVLGWIGTAYLGFIVLMLLFVLASSS